MKELRKAFKEAYTNGTANEEKLQIAVGLLHSEWEKNVLPVQHFLKEEFFHDELGHEQFYFLYFHQGQVIGCTFDVLTFCLKNNKQAFINGMRVNQVFLRSNVYKKIGPLLSFHADSELTQLYSIFERLKAEQQGVLSARHKHDNFLLKCPFDKLLMYAALHYSVLYCEKDNLQVGPDDLEVNYPGVLNAIIAQARKLQFDKNGKLKHSGLSGKAAYMHQDQIIVSILKGTDANWNTFEACYSSYNKSEEFDTKCKRYCYLGWGLRSVAGRFQAIPTSKQGERHIADGEKYRLYKNYFNNLPALGKFDFLFDEVEKAAKNDGQLESGFKTQTEWIQYIMAGLPDELEISADRHVKVQHLLAAINALAQWSKERFVQPILARCLGKSRKEILQGIFAIMVEALQKNNTDFAPLIWRETKEFIATVADILETDDLSFATEVVELLSHHPDNVSEKYTDTTAKPFIQIGSATYFMPHLMAYTDFGTQLINNVLQKKVKNENGEQQRLIQRKIFADEQENRIAEKWEYHDFKVKANHIYKKKLNGRGGEADLLAYKDKVLFVVQAKHTHFRATINEHQADYMQSIHKAARQLDFDLYYMQEKWDEIAKLLSIPHSYEEVMIKPFILTTNFEHESGVRINGTYQKISLFELDLILHNQKHVLHFSVERMLKLRYGKNLPKHIVEMMIVSGDSDAFTKEAKDTLAWLTKRYPNKFPIDSDLWEGKPKLSGERLLEVIEKSLVWKAPYEDL